MSKWVRVLSLLVLLAALSPFVVAQSATATQTSPQTSDLQTAYEILQSKTFVDLTHSFSPFTPVWQGFGQASFTAAADPETGRPYTIDDDGFRSEFFSFVGQYGTHIDPPAHFDPDGATLDAIPLKEMILPLVVFDATPLLADDPDHAFSLDDLKAWEQEHSEVPAGAFAALRTDLSKDWDTDPERFKHYPFPGWSFDAVQFLFEQRGVTAIGHESLDTDITEDFKSETYLLTNDHWQIEVMTNLDQVPATGALWVVTWPKPLNGLGFPARAFAILP